MPIKYQPIEEAPKDGTGLLLVLETPIERDGYYDYDESQYFCIGNWATGHNVYTNEFGWFATDVNCSIYSGSELTGSWNEYYRIKVVPIAFAYLKEPTHAP